MELNQFSVYLKHYKSTILKKTHNTLKKKALVDVSGGMGGPG